MLQSRLIFDKYDSSGNGTVTKEEFHNLCYGLGHHLDDESFEAAWCEVETDGSGELTYEEFMQWWQSDDRWEHLQHAAIVDHKVIPGERVHKQADRVARRGRAERDGAAVRGDVHRVGADGRRGRCRRKAVDGNREVA